MPADDSQNDIVTIGANAQSPDDRRKALDACLENYWSADDIARLERRDKDGWHGWDMWRK